MYAMYSIWTILYSQSPGTFGVELVQMRTYGVLGVLLTPLLNASVMIQMYVATQVRTGLLEMDLMKPLDFLYQMLCRSLAETALRFVMSFLPGALVAFLFLDFRLPATWEHGAAFLASLVLGYVVYFAINLMMGMLAIVTLDIRNYSWAFNSLVRFASGTVPLWMFPSGIAAVLNALPFKDVYFIPIAIYVGAYEGSIRIRPDGFRPPGPQASS